ncbi:hypothetical protein GCM10007304_31650 [Rhodococcoides trifolii]|uniref:DUF4245 domain-containing protein n=1 Tax=Rhodococcoides trifolii TaxID=908250 RepID=A0A917LE55_9NOCA|nr:DUF4245 domain-containing protein [Rhodococcus trifolii]GGG15248.1 hypothetical protein GCM10007304_31650 [Rhodococcus trifolii]
MADKKPRILQNNKDMAWSLIPLLLACLVIAAVAGQCSLRVGGPSQGEVPRVDLGASLQADAAALPFPVRQPQIPESWIPNSASRPTVTGDKVASMVGFITDKGNFLGLTQSDATEDQLVEFVAKGSRTATGSENLGGTNWVVYGGDGVESIWVADFGRTHAVVTGSGTSDEFVTLATAVSSARPLAS